MIRLFASLLRWNSSAPRLDGAPWPKRDPHRPLRIDALDEYLRGTSHSDVTPEVLLRIL